MADLVQIIVDTDSSYPGFDYTTLATAESTEQEDITVSGTDEYVVFECYATAGTADNFATFDGWVTEAGNYVEVTGFGDSSYGHQGVWDDGEYRVISTSSSCINYYLAHFRTTGLQIYQSVASSVRMGIRDFENSDATALKIHSYNLIKGDSSATYNMRGITAAAATGGVVRIFNNIIYDLRTAATTYGIYLSGGTNYIYNNTIIGGTYSIYRGAGTIISINNACQDTVTAAFGGGVNPATGYNIIEDGTLGAGSIGGASTDLANGSATSYSANELNDSGGGLSAAIVGSVVENDTDSTYAYVTVVDSDIKLTLSADIFDTGNEIYSVTSNIYGQADFQASGSENYLLTAEDILAMFAGSNLYADSNSPVTDDILGNSRGSADTDNFDIGAHHSLEYNRIVDTDSGAGYDYTTLNSYESNEQTDLTATGLYKASVATCRCTGGTNDTSNVTIDGWDTSAANYIKVWTDTTEAYRHSGEWITGNYYRLVVADSFGISIGEFNVRVEGLMIHITSWSGNACGATILHPVASGPTDIRISHNISRGQGSAVGDDAYHCGFVVWDVQTGSSGSIKIFNNIMYGWGSSSEDYKNGGIYFYDAGGSTYVDLYAYNNTIIDCGYGICADDNISGKHTFIKNNIVQDCYSDYLLLQDATWGSGSTHNITNDTISADIASGSTSSTGTATSYGASQLNDSGGGLSDAQVGSIVENDTETTYARVTVVNSDTQLTLSADIFDNGNEDYIVYTNMYGDVDFTDETGDDFTLNYLDEVAILKGTNLYSGTELAITDDILGNSRGSVDTDSYDVGAHHSLEYGRVVDPDSGSGYDYTSLNTWESNEQADLQVAGLNKISVATCRCTGGTDDITATLLDGWTTIAANYIKIWTDPAESYRHSGSWDTGNYYRLIPSTSDCAIDVLEANVRIEGLMIHAINTNGIWDNAIMFRPGADNVVDFTVEKNILRGDTTATGNYYNYGVDIEDVDSGGSGKVKISNNIVYGFGASGINGGIYVYGSEVSVNSYIYNNTVTDCAYGISVEGSGGDVVLINNIVQDCSVVNYWDFGGDEFHSSSGYDVTDDTLSVTYDDWGTTHATGTATSYTANKLNDSGGGLSAAQVGSIVLNDTDSTISHVTVVDSDTQLTLNADIFDTGNEVYKVYTRMWGYVDFTDETGDDFTLNYLDEVAILKGTNLYSGTELAITDDILGNSRGSVDTDSYDVGAHHSLEYGRVVDPDSGAGYDYTSLSTWESTEQNDLTDTGLYKISVATCRSTSGGDDTHTGINILGWTTESDNYIKVWTDPNESYRHEGIWDSSAYILDYTSTFVGVNIEQDYIRIEGLQIVSSNVTEAQTIIRFRNEDGYRIEKCLIKSGTAGIGTIGIYMQGNTAGINCLIANNIIYDIGDGSSEYGIHGEHNSTGKICFYNNTIHNCYAGIDTSSDDSIAINNIIQDCSGGYGYNGTFDSDSGYNIWDDTPASLGIFGQEHASGTTDDTGTGQLIDTANGDFINSGVQIYSLVKNTTDTTYTYVTGVDSATQLSLSNDYFVSGEGYIIYTNMRSEVVFQNEGNNEFLLGSSDTAAKDKGKDLSDDAYFPITDDILGTTRS